MRLRDSAILAGVGIVGGALPWLASFAGVTLLQDHPGLPLLIGQSVIMPVVAIGTWLFARRWWPKLSRLMAALLMLGIWVVPGVWVLCSGSRAQGGPTTMSAVASFLIGGPVILSVYMLNSIGLGAALLSLAVAASWPKARIVRGV